MMLNHHVKFQVDRIRNVEVVRGTDILCDRQKDRQTDQTLYAPRIKDSRGA